MKKLIIILSGLFLSITMQAQDRTQPKPGPAPIINIKKPQSFTLLNGLKVLIVENHKLPRVSFNLSIDNAPFAEGDKKGVDNLTGSLVGNGSQKISKDAFNEEIDFLGADINFYAAGASANCLSKYSGRILELMADGVLSPNFTQVEFDKEKDKLIEGLKTQEKSIASVASRVQNVLAYGRKHPYGEYLSENTIKNVTLDDVIKNYNTNFVPENAYLVIVGDVKFAETKKAVEQLFGMWLKATAPKLDYSDPRNVQYTQINFVDMPNAVQSEIALQNTVNLKMTDKEYFASIIANQILGGDFNSYLNMNLREKHAWTYGARSGISGNKYISTFKASTQVRNAVTDSAVVEFLKEFKRIRAEKVSDEVLSNVKAGYIGKFVMQIEKPQTVAGYALRIKTQNLPADFYENYIKSINAVTSDDVLAAANKYFLADNTRIVIVGKGSEILKGLESLKIPIFYFDKYGNPAEKPKMNTEVSSGITTKNVFDNYFKAIGGEKAVKAIKTISMTGSATLPQAPMPLVFNSKKDISGKSMVDVSMTGMGSMMKQVVNEKGAYSIQQGQRKEFSGQDLIDKKLEATTFEELLLISKTDVTLDGIETINGNDAYIIKNGKSKIYYDVRSGLKVSENTEIGDSDKKMIVTKSYSDYRELNGVKFPYELIINQGFELDIKMSEIKINEGVSDKDFE